MSRKRWGFCVLIGIVCVIAGIVFGVNQKRKVLYQGELEDTSNSLENVSSDEEIALDGAENMYQSPDGITHTDIEEQLQKAKKSENTIVWITEGGEVASVIPKQHLIYFNQLLDDAGYGFQLAVCYLNSEESGIYAQTVEAVLKKGYGDICFTGYTEMERYVQEKLIRKGYFTELDALLETEKGEVLKNALNQEEWEDVRIDGKLYTVPNQNILPRRSYVAFSKKYFKEEDVSGFDGDFSVLKDFISPEMEKELGGSSLVWQLDYIAALNSMGIYDMGDAWGNHETGEIITPFTYKKFYEMEQMLWECKKNGVLFTEASLTEFSTEKGRNQIESNQFGIAVFSDAALLQKIKKGAIVVELPYYFVRGVKESTGIVKVSDKQEAALELMGLLYSESKFANALLFGKEGVDYQVKGGCAFDPESQKFIQAYGLRTVFGINDSAYTSDIGEFTPDVREQKKKYFNSGNYHKSIFTGFQPDGSSWNDDMEELDNLLLYVDAWKEDDFETAYLDLQKLAKKVTAFGKNELEEQLKEWQEAK